MVIQDWDTVQDKTFKERMAHLTTDERSIIFTLEEKEQEALLKLKDNSLDWNVRYEAGKKLTSDVLKVVLKGYHGFKSIPAVILQERHIL